MMAYISTEMRKKIQNTSKFRLIKTDKIDTRTGRGPIIANLQVKLLASAR